MGPILESLSSQVSKDVKIMKHNVDNEPAMAQKFNIRGIPTMVLLRDGRAVETLVGVRNEKQLLEVIERHKA
jgi:thioredoxin 1